MIYISKDIQLQAITPSDSDVLSEIIRDVYKPAYQHFWKDEGDWYLNWQYSKEHILKELSEEKAAYYFVIYKDEIIGNFRFVWDEKLLGLTHQKQVKLHRIYLHPKVHGNKIGRTLLDWLEEKAKLRGYQIIWLDAMDAQPQAFQFYKKLGFNYHSHTFLPFQLMFDEVRKMSQLYKEI